LRENGVDGVLLAKLAKLGNTVDGEVGVFLLEVVDLGVVWLGEDGLVIVDDGRNMRGGLESRRHGLEELRIDVNSADLGLDESVFDAGGTQRVVGGDNGDRLRRGSVGHGEPVVAAERDRVSLSDLSGQS